MPLLRVKNLDSDRQFGMELELTHRNKIGEVGYNLKGIATVTRQKYLTASEKDLGPTRMIAGATTT